ncbi:MAG: family 43 glycosylhydrolase [Clostridia bacterium]|nr:family 43 glycosylhydrolase [Clostridia bacterium]
MDPYRNTYINPTPLPDYPFGREASINGSGIDWRETADPTVLFENGKWYLFSSCRAGYESDDFRSWKRHDIEPPDIGYAPTVVNHRGKYYLCGSLSDLYVSDEPLGKYTSLGKFKYKNGEDIGNYYDPMLFSDDDGRLYIYYVVFDPEIGSTAINGCELDPDDPTVFTGAPVRLINYDPSHVWERTGEHNEDPSYSAIEGPWMLKHNGTYYLIYSGPATEYSTYADGAYKSDKPLSDFRYMKTSPFTRKTSGVVRGPGHGSVVKGPDDTFWVFYTCTLCHRYHLERMIGYDRIYFNEDGDIVCPEISENPRFAPGDKGFSENNGDTRLISLADRRRASASSEEPGREALYALTDDLTSFWQPASCDEEATLTIPLPPHGASVFAVRIIFSETGLSLAKGDLPRPVRYRIQLRNAESKEYVTVVDKSMNNEDRIVDYVTFDSAFLADSARFIMYTDPKPPYYGIRNISFFGTIR